MKQDIETFAYTAGYVDGDGCFYIGTYRTKKCTIYEASIQILSVKKPVLEFFQSFFGGFIRQKAKRINQKIPFVWSIKGFDAACVAINIKQYLIDKSYSCTCFIDYVANIKKSNYQKVSDEDIYFRNKQIENIRRDRHMSNFVTKELIESIKGSEKTVKPINTDFIYLAGLIDAEGCFRIKKWKPKNKPNHVYAINLEIGNTKFPIIPWLVERFGGSVTFVPAKTRKKASALWSLSAKSLFEILSKLHPYLRTKKPICEKLIEFQSTIIPNGGDRHSELFHSLFSKTLARRESIVNEIHALNSKGSN